MTPAMAPALPPGRVLTGWSRQLEPLRPHALWLGLVRLHYIEALVQTARSRPLDPLASAALKVLALWPDSTTAELDHRLHLGDATGGVLHRLGAGGLANHAHGRWSLAPAGQRAIDQNEFPYLHRERRSFHFVESGSPDHPSHFLRLRSHQGCVPMNPPPEWQFRVQDLRACIARPAEWKRRHDFPAEITGVCDVPTGSAGVPPWEQVVFDRAEGLWAVLVLTADESGGERLLGFAARPGGWALQAEEPAFVLPTDWQLVFPPLAQPPVIEDWRRGWLAWCHAHNIPAEEAAACTLELRGHRLIVGGEPALVGRLRSSRSEIVRGETWLFADDGFLRAAVQVEVIESAGPAPAQTSS